MADYYKQILSLAHDSIYATPSDNRELNVHTFAFAKKDFHKVKDLFDETLKKLRSIKIDDQNKDSVYEVTLLAFPVGESKQRGKS